LSILENNLLDEGATKLAEVLAVNKSITLIDVGGLPPFLLSFPFCFHLSYVISICHHVSEDLYHLFVFNDILNDVLDDSESNW